VPLALGSDTGGSIRQPASFCGAYGLKPTYGRVSRYGLIAFGSSLDQIGPLARNVADLALLYQTLAGPDLYDSTVSHEPVIPTRLEVKSLKGYRLAIIREFMGDGIDPEVRKSFDDALEILRKLGAEIVEVSIPHLAASIPVYYILATAEASSNLARFDGVRYGARSQAPHQNLKDMYLQSRSEGFGREVKQRIMLGTYVLSAGYYDAYYNRAARMRELIKREFDDVFKRQNVNFLLSPTAPTTAFELGKKTQDSLAMYLSDVYTIAANLVGIPAISQPIGRDSSGLPIGLQMMGPAFKEGELMEIAFQLEKNLSPMGDPDFLN
jgi:aspartyl-tRNA(Asn)/glutamyl-tRNA(Gln) amidotransferase subunit A